MILRLCDEGMTIVASCNFEGEIVELTRWNWFEKTPVHREQGTCDEGADADSD